MPCRTAPPAPLSKRVASLYSTPYYVVYGLLGFFDVEVYCEATAVRLVRGIVEDVASLSPRRSRSRSRSRKLLCHPLSVPNLHPNSNAYLTQSLRAHG
jgi:hypothetical protein